MKVTQSENHSEGNTVREPQGGNHSEGNYRERTIVMEAQGGNHSQRTTIRTRKALGERRPPQRQTASVVTSDSVY